MKIRINLEIPKLQRFCSLSPEYCEIITRNGFSILCSESGIRFNILLLDVLDGKLNDGNIRISTDLLYNLKTEKVLDLVENESEVSLTFYDSHINHLYTTKVSKQLGVIDISDKIDLIESVENYKGYDILKIRSIVELLSVLNQDVMCLNGLIYGEYMRNYIFDKCSMPNFCVASKDLKSLMSCVTKIHFIDRFIYGVTNEQVHVFLSKSRVPELCDIDFIQKSKFSISLKLDSRNIRVAQRKIKTTDKSSIILNLPDKQIDISTESFKSSISLGTSEIKSKKESSYSDEDILKAMIGENNLSVNMQELSNPYNLPRLILPRWILRYGFNVDSCYLFINRRFIILKLSGFKILFSRSDYE